MCLSKVYLSREDKDEIVAEEAASVIDSSGIIEISSIFDESKKVKGYFIKEVDFINNRTILSKRK
jgi:predicted RNA-binding protein